MLFEHRPTKSSPNNMTITKKLILLSHYGPLGVRKYQ